MARTIRYVTAAIGLVAAFLLGGTVATADVVSVSGTASGFEIGPTSYLAKIGYVWDPDDSFEFSYTYGLASEFSTGSFRLVSKSATGEILDTIDLNPTTVIVRQNENDFYHYDEYVAAAVSTRNGIVYQVMVDLVDFDENVFPTHKDDPAYYLNDLTHLWERLHIGVGVADDDCEPNRCIGFSAVVTSLSATVTPDPDSDGDGIPDPLDRCPGSSSGPVNASGCSIEQLVPCDGPANGGNWKNHGQYVSALTKTAEQFLQDGTITADQKDTMVAAGAAGICGR